MWSHSRVRHATGRDVQPFSGRAAACSPTGAEAAESHPARWWGVPRWTFAAQKQLIAAQDTHQHVVEII